MSRLNRLQQSINAAHSPGKSDKSLTFTLKYSIKMNPVQVLGEVISQNNIKLNKYWKPNIRLSSANFHRTNPITKS